MHCACIGRQSLVMANLGWWCEHNGCTGSRRLLSESTDAGLAINELLSILHICMCAQWINTAIASMHTCGLLCLISYITVQISTVVTIGTPLTHLLLLAAHSWMGEWIPWNNNLWINGHSLTANPDQELQFCSPTFSHHNTPNVSMYYCKYNNDWLG